MRRADFAVRRAPRSARRKLLIALSGVLLALVAMAVLLPVLMERAIATWLRYEATRSALRISFGQIHARLFRPVEIDDLRIVGAGVHGEHFDINIPRAEG